MSRAAGSASPGARSPGDAPLPAGAAWPWPARIPAMIFAYGGAVLAVLAAERFLHSPTSALYAAVAVAPGGLFAGIAAFALSFEPRRRLTLLAATVLVAVIPLAVIAIGFDFREFGALFQRRAIGVGAMLAAAVAVATSMLVAGGVFGRNGSGAPR